MLKRFAGNIYVSGVTKIYPTYVYTIIILAETAFLKKQAMRGLGVLAHYHLQVQANSKKIAQKNRCYF